MIDAIEVYTVSLLTCEGRYLLLQRSAAKSFAPGRWTGLGGKVEADEYEALRASALREVTRKRRWGGQIYEFVRRALLANRPQAPRKLLITGRLDEPVLPACRRSWRGRNTLSLTR
jgi:8-oxo-dGTP diphosphatase